MLAAIPPHPAATGFVRGRGFPDFAALHSGQRVVVRLDLQGFFASVGAGRVRAILRRVGYPAAVASALAGICTLRTPGDVLRRLPRRGLDPAERAATIGRLRAPHLPQGAPSSPALSNLALFGLDRRLSALAAAAGARYSRYADDLALSGGRAFERALPGLLARAGAIVIEEGFQLRYRKQRVMRAGGRQQLGGLTVNVAPNMARADYDRLRALLHNAARTGPDAQNRSGHPCFREHLLGRIAWVHVLHPKRGARLRGLFDRIDWPDEGRR